MSNELVLGNLDAMRDWGHAKDYVRGMWLMLQQDNPDDYVLATGISNTVYTLVQYVFDKLDLSMDYVKIDDRFKRPEELDYLRGDATKAISKLGWTCEYTFETMLDEMIEYWLKYYKSK